MYNNLEIEIEIKSNFINGDVIQQYPAMIEIIIAIYGIMKSSIMIGSTISFYY